MSDEFVNKVAESGLITIDLEEYYPKEPTAIFDMKEHLFMGLIIKEKEFREALKNLDLSIYQNKNVAISNFRLEKDGLNVAITFTTDAIIPVWAYMLVTTYLQPIAKEVVFGNEDFLHKTIFLKNLHTINVDDYIDKRVVIKGCGELPITEAAYVEITKRLHPVVKSIMYGEPCSTVPIYKKPKV